MPSPMKVWVAAAPSPLPSTPQRSRPSRGTPCHEVGLQSWTPNQYFIPIFPAEDRGQGQGRLHRNHSAHSIFIVSNKRRGRARSRSLGEILASREIPFLTPMVLGSCRSKKKSPQLDPPASAVCDGAWGVQHPRRTHSASRRHSDNDLAARSCCRLEGSARAARVQPPAQRRC